MSTLTQVIEVKDVTSRAAWGVLREVIDNQKSTSATVNLNTGDDTWELVITAKKKRAARKKATRATTTKKRTTKK